MNKAIPILLRHGFEKEADQPYYRRWFRDQRAYVVAMSAGEGEPMVEDFGFYFSVCDGMEEFESLLSAELIGDRYLSFEAACNRVDRLEQSFLPDAAFDSILTPDDGRAWIKAMHDAGCLFHFDDDPRTVNWSDPTGLTETAALLLDHQVEMLMALATDHAGFCPYGEALAIMEAAGTI